MPTFLIKEVYPLAKELKMLQSQDLIKKAAVHAEEYMSQFDSSHDFEHIKRVVGLSHHIYSQLTSSNPKLELDLEVITLSALLHDVGDRKYLKPGQDEQTLVLNLLLNFGADEVLAQKVQTICLGVSYTSEIQDLQKVQNLIAQYPELAVVQDADRLDALGAVGIGRLFTYGGAKTRRTLGGSMDLMKGKLLKLESMMKTVPGRVLAKERTERVRAFRGWWDEETEAREGLERIFELSVGDTNALSGSNYETEDGATNY
jgi:uncharacterized protein